MGEKEPPGSFEGEDPGGLASCSKEALRTDLVSWATHQTVCRCTGRKPDPSEAACSSVSETGPCSGPTKRAGGVW